MVAIHCIKFVGHI